MNDVLRLADAEKALDGRFARLELIEWWDQTKLSNARVVVIGAGALGNELLKNLALLGIGNVFVADLDLIENSNLSRSVLYRAADCGKRKADVAAERARDIYPEMKTQPFHGNVVYDLGLGLYRWADLILGGLDNREARVAINRAAARAGRIWIDGAIERLDGVARVFDPAVGPCYECTMSDIDWKMLEARRSCALLSRDEMEQGKVPTTPTTASIVAGIQIQEAIKYLHGLPTLSGGGFVFDGLHHQSYQVTYSRKDDCPSHEPDDPVASLAWKTTTTTVRQLLERVRQDLGPQAVIEVNNDLLSGLTCEKCQITEPMFASLGKITQSQGQCPSCGEHRTPQIYHTLDGSESFVDRTLSEIGVPPWEVVAGRRGMEQRFYEFAGDAASVLGPLSARA